jgi:hypothetical protein
LCEESVELTQGGVADVPKEARQAGHGQGGLQESRREALEAQEPRYQAKEARVQDEAPHGSSRSPPRRDEKNQDPQAQLQGTLRQEAMSMARRRRNPARKSGGNLNTILLVGLGGGALYMLYAITQSLNSAASSVSGAASSASGTLNSISGSIAQAAGAVGQTATAAQGAISQAGQVLSQTGAAVQGAAGAASQAAGAISQTAGAYNPQGIISQVFG